MLPWIRFVAHLPLYPRCDFGKMCLDALTLETWIVCAYATHRPDGNGLLDMIAGPRSLAASPPYGWPGVPGTVARVFVPSPVLALQKQVVSPRILQTYHGLLESLH